MTNASNVILVIGILILVLVIGMMKNKTEILLNFLLRGLSGMMMIYFYNYAGKEWLGGTEIGYNIITFLTSGILGFPGVALIFGINFYMNL